MGENTHAALRVVLVMRKLWRVKPPTPESTFRAATMEVDPKSGRDVAT